MPAKERSERGENKTDGSDFELYTKLECIRAVRDRTDVEEYTVGKELAARFGALDDVVLNVTLRGTRELTYALQAKQTLEGDPSKPDKVISSQDLWRECGNKNYYVAKYFASYLKIKQHTRPEQLKEMIIWTTQSIADTALTNFEPYVTDGQDDILKPVLGSDVRRWKFDSSKMDHPDYGDLKQLLLDEVHPLKAVVDKFISVMFKKETWDSNKGARNYYRIMAQEVIDCDMKVFQDRFIRGDCSLDSNTQLFRRIFERAMALKIPKFSMDLLNSENYKRYFILQIDDQFQKGNGQYAWKVESSASQADLEDFIARFVFYVNVPKVADFRNKLTQKLGANRFKELCGLVQQCTVEQMASKAEIDAIFELLVLRSKTNLKKDPGLEFEGDDGGLRSVLKDNNRIFIEAVQDIDCSVNRVFMTEEFANAMQPCLAFRYRNFERCKNEIIAVTKHAKVCEHGLRSVVVSGIDVPSVEGLMKELELFNGKVICLGEKVPSQHVDDLNRMSLIHHKDEFDVDKLTLDCKNFISSKEINVFGNIATVGELFSDDLIRKENYQLVMKLYRQPASECFNLGRNKLTLDPYFDSRLKELNNYLDSPIVLSDQAGMGKTTEMFYIADNIRNQRQDCLAVYLDCKIAVTHFRKIDSPEAREKLIQVVCKMIQADTDEYQILMVREMFGSGRVFLLLDGYDEVSDESQKCLEEMIAACSAANLRGLCIATRPHCLERIKLKLGQAKEIRIYSLNPFTKEEQLEYLMKTWNIRGIPFEKRTLVEKNATKLIHTFQTVFKHEALLGIPLQMKMISTVYAEEIKSDSFELPKSFQMGSILEKFVQRRLDLVVEKIKTDGKAQEYASQLMRKEFPADHVKMALSVYWGSTEHVRDLFEKNETYGLVRLNPSEAFCHETYLSYFLALHFTTHRTEPDEFKQYMKRYLCLNRVDVATKFMDFHLGKLMHNPDAIQLLKDKTNEFSHYLAKSCTETERFTLIRSSMNATSFSVFDLLHASLTESDRRKLRFRFGGEVNETENRHLINLKRLGGNQTLQLLRVLRRKHGTSFVGDILTNFLDDEEDFIAVACRKPFLEVFRWLFERVPELVVEERDALLEYLRKRVPGYLEVLIQHNNAALLEEIIVWVQSNWSREVLVTWVENYELLWVFASNVGRKCVNKELHVDSRTSMVKIIYDFCRWIYGDNVLLPEPCLSAIADIEQEGITNAFIQHFKCCQ
ncbi:uncharacterized protein LOC6039781 [Culex quinquefasciatus]|uniref:uncharacterized protein LOC6039781 n=1 Tax=Culex quinquefasciatus TaxID=7176 RepID=UPI0018E33802|nr:uncharacterized protein LOC6039781 [Culex quinquefasciatus]